VSECSINPPVADTKTSFNEIAADCHRAEAVIESIRFRSEIGSLSIQIDNVIIKQFRNGRSKIEQVRSVSHIHLAVIEG
jgi:hypothetical protein